VETATADLRQWIDTLPDPAWLREARRQAAEQEARTQLPRWDRTDISRLDLSAYVLPAAGSVEFRLPPGAEARGVVLGTIDRLAVERPDLVQRYLGRLVRPEAGKFEARNAAAHQGCLLYVPEGVTLAEPVEIVYRLQPVPAAQFHPRTVIALGRLAEVTVLQREEGGPEPGRGGALVTGVVEAEVADGAQLRFVEVQNWSEAVQSFVTREAAVGRDARVHWLIGELGSGLTRSGTTTVLRDSGGEALSLLVFFASGRQHMDLLTTLRHFGARTNGLMLARGVLSGHARAIYRGTSDIKHGAKDSNSQQKENVLHLSPHVRSEAIPALYINENQLQAGHAATTGKIDEEQMFYMATRGVPRREAERLIVYGFFEPLLERIAVEEARQAIRELIDRKIDAGEPERAEAGAGR
jgi:Fe-S cluster assembly protein SufD